MTAEIAILNKNAVALAADSAVTFSNGDLPKIFNTVNKIFDLGPSQPIGIMIYGNAEFMAVPWETIIAMFRKHLSNRKFDTIEDYGKEFIAFLESNEILFPQNERRNIKNYLTSFFHNIRKLFMYEINEFAIKTNADIPDEMSAQILSNILTGELDKCNNLDKPANFDNDFCELLNKEFSALIKSTADDFFESAPIPDSRKGDLYQIGRQYLECRNPNSPFLSGVVFAGFGEKDIFPCLLSYEIDILLLDRIKIITRKLNKISNTRRSGISPFAQREMVVAFMEGITPKQKKHVEEAISDMFDETMRFLTATLEGYESIPKEEVISKLNQEKGKFVTARLKKLREFQVIEYIKPVMDAVTALPKAELASVAEALVYLTSLKKKVTMDSETVGGPIDVAVISKCDGFVWIKKKQYYEEIFNKTKVAGKEN